MVRPAALLVQQACSGQTRQARPKWATPPPPWAGMISMVSLAGQVTVPRARSMRNCCLVKFPAGAVGAATFVIAVIPRPWNSASSAPVP